MAITRDYWSDFDSSIFISQRRDISSRSGAATDSADEITARVLSISDPGFERDIRFDKSIANKYITRDGGYQPIEVSVRFVMNDNTLHDLALQGVTQNGFNTTRHSKK